MSISWIGEDALWPALDGAVRVVVANDAPAGNGTAIIGALIALHPANGAPQLRRATGLELEADESYALDDEPPLAKAPSGVEAILRLRTPESSTREVYIRSDDARTTPAAFVTVGLIDTDSAPDDAVEVQGVDGLSVYIKLEP